MGSGTNAAKLSMPICIGAPAFGLLLYEACWFDVGRLQLDSSGIYGTWTSPIQVAYGGRVRLAEVADWSDGSLVMRVRMRVWWMFATVRSRAMCCGLSVMLRAMTMLWWPGGAVRT